MIEGPAPALFVLPQVALTGLNANQTLASLVLGAVAVAAGTLLALRLGVPSGARLWLVVFLAAGTDLWWAAQLGDVWMLAQVSAVAFTLLALVGMARWQHPWLVGVCAALAGLSRFPLLLALPIYLVAAWRHSRRSAVLFLLALAPFAAFWLWYNLARWGTWSDIGYVAWYHADPAGSPSGLPTQLRYLPYELHSFFLQAPSIVSRFPPVIPGLSGVALTLTSPALLFAVWARVPRSLVIGLWLATVLVAAPSFLYYVNGYAQYGMRHALDFEPFIFALMALAAARRGLPVLVRVAIAWSCVGGAYGVWYWTVIVRPGN